MRVADSRAPHGPWPNASKSLLIMRKQMISPPDRFEPPATSSHAGKCFLITWKKSYLSLTAGTHQLYYDPFHENIDCTKYAKLFPFYSNSKKKKLKKTRKHLRTQGSATLLRAKNDSPASWDPPDLEVDLWAYLVDAYPGLCQLSQ